MCGRYSLMSPPDIVRDVLGYPEIPNFPPRANIAPTQPVAIVCAEGTGRRFALARWGLLPGWVKDERAFPLLFNARAETAEGKPAFRGAMRYRRCLVPADGWYEWRREGKLRRPFRFQRPGGGPIAFAGLWETWSSPHGGEIDTACILTVSANGACAAVHERMPALLEPGQHAAWLDHREVAAGQAAAMLRPAADDAVELFEVAPLVNKVGNDGPELAMPLNPA